MTTLSSIAHIDLTHNAKSHNKVITIDPNAKIMEALEVRAQRIFVSRFSLFSLLFE